MNHKVIISFDQGYVESHADKVWDFYTSSHPIAKYSGGSVVAMIDSDYWLDYYNVPTADAVNLLRHIDSNYNKQFKKNIRVEIGWK